VITTFPDGWWYNIANQFLEGGKDGPYFVMQYMQHQLSSSMLCYKMRFGIAGGVGCCDKPAVMSMSPSNPIFDVLLRLVRSSAKNQVSSIVRVVGEILKLEVVRMSGWEKFEYVSQNQTSLKTP
jgi:hypothetical protein